MVNNPFCCFLYYSFPLGISYDYICITSFRSFVFLSLGGVNESLKKIFHPFFIDSDIYDKPNFGMNKDKNDKVYICRKCNIETDYISGNQNGNYFVCKTCRDITLIG